MHGFAVFLRKEFSEIFRTWRIWVMPLIMVFIGVSSPVLAKLTPQLVESLASAEQTGITIEVPDPVTIDAYLQFFSNAMQLATIGVIIAAAGMIAAEKRSGTAVLVLTKPVSRTGMVVAKVLSNIALLLGATALGAALCAGLTAILFDTTAVADFALSTVLWLLFAAMLIACMAVLSVLIGSQGGAAGAGIGLFLIVSIFSAWGPTRNFSPAGLVTAGNQILVGEQVELLWPVLSAVAVTILAVALAAWLFERQEL